MSQGQQKEGYRDKLWKQDQQEDGELKEKINTENRENTKRSEKSCQVQERVQEVNKPNAIIGTKH